MTKRAAFSLIELLCVIAVISILASLLLPAVARSYRRAQAMSEESEEPAIAEMLRNSVRAYCASHAQYQFDTKTDLADKCVLPSKCHRWITDSHTVFTPFTTLDSTNKVVVVFHYGRNYGLTDSFTKGELTIIR